MTPRTIRLRLVIVIAVMASLGAALWPEPAQAQYYGPPRVSIGVSFGFGPYWYPGYGYYRPFYPPYWGAPFYPYGAWGPWGPYPPYGPYWGYPGYYGYPYGLTSSLRLQITPRAAKVYVDGYAAGTVDDFDGVFQRLNVRPGGHEITVYLDGYRTVHRTIYFRPDADESWKMAMEPTGPGETSEPPPPPKKEAERDTAPQREPMPPQREVPPQRVEPPPVQDPREPQTRFGALSIAVQPIDAEIYVDGVRWTIGEEKRLLIKLPEGRHTVEVRKEGFATYVETIGIGRDRTLTLNVSLARQLQDGNSAAAVTVTSRPAVIKGRTR